MSTGFTQGVYNYKNKRFVDFTSSANSASAETTIYSYTIPGGSFQNDGDTMFAQFMGSGANDANTKFINLYWGTTSLASTANGGLAQNGDITFDSQSGWMMSLLMIRTGTASFRSGVDFVKMDRLASSVFAFGIGVNYQGISGSNLSSPNVLKITTSGSVSNEMYVHYSNVTFK